MRHAGAVDVHSCEHLQTGLQLRVWTERCRSSTGSPQTVNIVHLSCAHAIHRAINRAELHRPEQSHMLAVAGSSAHCRRVAVAC